MTNLIEQDIANKKTMWAITIDFLDDRDVFINNTQTDSAEYNLHKLLKTPNAVDFRMYDDDDELYYSGTMICADGSSPIHCGDLFAPLDDYGRPNAGCTRISIQRNGKWEVV